MDQENSISVRLEAATKLLEEYESANGIPYMRSPGSEKELQTYLNMSKEELELIQADDLAIVGVRLNQYSYYVSRLCNVEKSNIKWLECLLNDIVAPLSLQFDNYTKHDVKIGLIKQENKGVRMVSQLLTQAQCRVQRLEGLAFSIKCVADSYDNYRKTKVYRVQ